MKLMKIHRITFRKLIVYVVFIFLLIYIFIGFPFNHNGFLPDLQLEITSKEKSLDPQVNQTWVELRKELLSRNKVAKVFIFCYMRGGSSLFAEIFNRDAKTGIMFYEPLDAFYQSYYGFNPNAIPLSILYDNCSTPRIVHDRERNEMTNYLEAIFSCRYDRLPIETFAHDYFNRTAVFSKEGQCTVGKKGKKTMIDCVRHVLKMCGNDDTVRRNVSVAIRNRCPDIIRALKRLLPDQMKTKRDLKLDMSAITDNVSLLVGGLSPDERRRVVRFVDHHVCKATAKSALKRDCLRSIQPGCGADVEVVAVKVIRSRMADLEPLIQRNPDVHVLYLTRDPRAVSVSRRSLGLFYSPDDDRLSTEAGVLCRRMLEDVEAKKVLEKRYPGSIRTVRYEDFVRDLQTTAIEAFRSIGRRAPLGLRGWLADVVAGSPYDGNYGIKRPNVTGPLEAWTWRVTFKEALEMTKHCETVLAELGYDLYKPAGHDKFFQ